MGGAAHNVMLIGAGGHGRVVLDIVRQAGVHRPVGFIDADPAKAGTQILGMPVLGPVNLMTRLRKLHNVTAAIVAIGDNRTRMRYAQLVLEEGLELVSAIHPSAIVSPTASIGRNVVVGPGAVINTEARIGDSVIVNSSAVVEHECRIEAGVHLCPGSLLAGRVHLESGAFVGMGAKVLPCLRIGAFATVGAGAVVREDVPEGTTAVGVPARLLRRGEE